MRSLQSFQTLYLFRWKIIYIDSFPHFSVFGRQHTKKSSQRKTIFSQWKTLIKTRLIFYGMFSNFFFFLENNLSLTHHISYKYIFFLYPLQPRETSILAPLSSVSQSYGKLSVFSLLFAFLSSHILTVSPPLVSPLFSFHRSLSICLSRSTTLPCSIPTVRFLISIMLTRFAIQVFNGSHYSIIRHCNYCQMFCIQKHQKSYWK